MTEKKFIQEVPRARKSRLDSEGREINSGIPLEPPLGYKRTPSLAEQIRAMVQSENMAQIVAAEGAETFEESEDFDVGDDFDPHSPYENEFDPSISELIAAGHEALQSKNIAAGGQQSKPAEPLKAVPAEPENSEPSSDNTTD